MEQIYSVQTPKLALQLTYSLQDVVVQHNISKQY